MNNSVFNMILLIRTNILPPSMIFIFLLKSHLFTIFHLLEMSPYG